ncbi:hypothetical protein DSM110093_02926 [Sulfitobacter sp. DSM 110093]|uniref:TRAP transporter small permease n=1 Tax=Sulfitobacter sp. DSM 110093 TaxID=2883127 RepID=UPI001FAD8A3D|nr:TRAP transporter small permease [Sulfitobacter sp. DSM 110093]UOA33114.1 hypothetical protein DSM110093_02926 [Sulfitobacter sp. DSM 110093]
MKTIKRLLAAVENVLVIFGALALFLLMVLVAGDAGGRYFLNAPISGVYEISEFYLMISIVFLSFAHTQRKGAHVRVDFVLERLPKPAARIFEFTYLVSAAIVFGLVAYVAAKNGLKNIALNRWTTGVVAIPTGPSWLIMALGTAVFTVRLCIDAVEILFTSGEGDDGVADVNPHSADGGDT